MPVEVVMPRLSDTMEKGTVARWLKHVGDEIQKGESLAEIETDKATMPLEAFSTGRLQQILLPEGETVPIGTPIAVIVAPGEAAPAPAGQSAPSHAAPPGQPAPSRATASAPAAASQPAPSPAHPAAPVVAPPESPAAVRASPIAKRLAEELGVNLHQVTGTGPGGRIVREDVEAAAHRAAPSVPPAPAPAPAPAPTAAPPTERPLTRIQETIARRMVQSKTTVPHFYLTMRVDMGAAANLREQLNQTWTEGRVGYTEMIVKAVGLALQAYPLVNASWHDGHLVYHEEVNVGVAVAVENGLLVPVLHQVDQKGLRTLAKEVKELVQRTREGKNRGTDFEGGTFSVSSLGQYPIESFLAIINPPESGILAVGRIEKVPAVRDDVLVVAQEVHLTLSGDHRVFYGAYGAEFMAKLKDLLEHPLSLLA